MGGDDGGNRSAADVFAATRSEDPRIRLSVANRADLPPADLALLLADPAPEVRRQAIANPSIDLEALAAHKRDAPRLVRRRLKSAARDPERALGMARSGNEDLMVAVLRHSSNPDALASLAEHAPVAITRALARRSTSPLEVQQRLLAHPDILTAMSMAQNPSIDVSLLRPIVARGISAARRRRLALDVRRNAVGLLHAAAQNPSLDSHCLDRLAAAPRWDVRATTARNAACWRGGVESPWAKKLLHDADWAVRAAAAASPATAPAALRALAYDSHEAVRLYVAGNGAAPSEAVERLATWSSVWAPQRWSSAVAPRDQWVRGLALSNPHLRREVFERCLPAMDAPAWVLAGAAKNPSAPPSFIDEVGVWLALGGAGRAPLAFDPRVCAGVPVEGPVDIAAYYRDQAGAQPLAHPLWRCRVSVAGGGKGVKVPHSVLRVLARDPIPQVRRRVLDFSPLPLSLLDELRLDANVDISRRADNAYETIEKLPRRKRPREFVRVRSSLRARLVVVAVAICVAIGSVVISHVNEPRSTSATLPPTPGETVSPSAGGFTALAFGSLDDADIMLGTIGSSQAPMVLLVTTHSRPITVATIAVDPSPPLEVGAIVPARRSELVYTSLSPVDVPPGSVVVVTTTSGASVRWEIG